MTVQEMIDRATVQAWPDPNGAPARAGLVANSLLPQVFEDATKGLSSGSLPRLAKALTFTNGVATLSSDVLTGYMGDAVLYDPDDSTKEYSYVGSWEDFIRVYDTRIGYFTIRGGTAVYVIEPGETYAEGDGLDGDLTLVVVGVPAVPASAGSAISAGNEFTNRALEILVERLRGLVPVKDD
jgi:hypothetical protein